MRVVIIEDEAPAYRRLNNLLAENHSEIEVIEVIDSVSEAIVWFGNNKCPDLLFSDIQLADGLSFEIYEKIEIQCPIIFTTAYDEYMLDAFKTNGIDYLLKPIEAAELERSIAKFNNISSNQASDNQHMDELLVTLKHKNKKYKSRFLIKIGSKLLPVQVDDIAYFTSSDGLSEIITNKGKHLVIDYTLDDLESQLDPSIFFRLNRKFLCNISSISSIHQYFKGKLKVMLIPEQEQEVIVSREKARVFKNWMGR